MCTLMPNLNEIAEFRKELKKVAQEEKIVADWKEPVYDELPMPEQKAPEIDLDALLPADIPAADPAADQTAAGEPDNAGNAGAVQRSNAADSAGQDMETINTEAGTDNSIDFDDFLSSLDMDSPAPAATNNGESAPETDEHTPSGGEDSFELPAFDPDLLDTATGEPADILPHSDEKTGDSDIDATLDDMSNAVNDESFIPDVDAEPENDASLESDNAVDFDNFLSSFDFDTPETPPANGAAQNEPVSEAPVMEQTGSKPEAADDSFDSLIPEMPELSEEEPGASDSAGADTDESQSDLDLGDMLSSMSFDAEPSGTDDPSGTGDGDAGTVEPVDEEMNGGSGSEELLGAEPEIGEDEDGFPTFDFSGFDTADTPSDGSADTVPDDAPPAEDSAAESATDTADTESADDSSGDIPAALPEEMALFSESREDFDDYDKPDTGTAAEEPETIISDLETPEEPVSAVQPEEPPAAPEESLIPPMPAASESVEEAPPTEELSVMPELPREEENPDHTGFSLEENVLETDIAEVADDQFNLPDNFKDFSADSHAHNFNSIIAASTSDTLGDATFTISDDEYFDFLNRLESFPLNVQLAIQNYIGNGEDTDENKMAFVRLILSKASLKKIVRKLESILNQSIPIPKGFQRKSVEEYEREKKTFKYWFLHRFLPVAVMTGIAVILVFCISVLSWQFIYKPVTSESLYKSGYTYLENDQYDTAIEKFNKAGEYQRKKKWYFRYARAFRNKKQFTAAEKMYNRLLYDFNYDKTAGLEYADMLSTDLRNYEKAEAVLRRKVLDQHVNDKDGLLALGDVFMNWGDEDPSKYDDAVKIYSRLIELYGANDTFLARMMRYFIRTDNLAEVLPLKEHFVSRLSKLSPADITELSGYLLEKRYNPKPLDSETLRNRIDDVRVLLEKAVQADGTVPEAYYNLGRFFIYNRKLDAAVENLTQAIQRFETAAPMTTRRTISYIDSLRLLGEQLVEQKKYLDAQNLYANALNIYRDYTAFKPLPPNKLIGKLYADYGDIDYFISSQFDSALDSYQNAVRELNDTPSINYRIGYIHYRQENYQKALEAMGIAAAGVPNDKNVLYGFGNSLFKRGDYFAAQASYEQLMDLLNAQRARKGIFFPNTRPDDADFIEQYMYTANNLGATLHRLAERTGDSQKNARALALYAEATRAWDALTRNPQTLIRSKSTGLAYLNTQNLLNPNSIYNSEIYADIPMTLEGEKGMTQKEDK